MCEPMQQHAGHCSTRPCIQSFCWPSPVLDSSHYHIPIFSLAIPCPSPAERPDVHYSLLAVDFMSHDGMHAALMRISQGLFAGQLRPLPTITHDLAAVAAALRQMSQARHVGKVVVSAPAAVQQDGLDGRFLVTGGVGALGTLVSRVSSHRAPCCLLSYPSISTDHCKCSACRCSPKNPI